MSEQTKLVLARANVLKASGHRAGALDLLASAREEGPDGNARLAMARADLLIEMEDYDAALALILDAEGDYEDEHHLHNLSVAFYNAGRLRDSAAIDECLVRRDSDIGREAENDRLRSLLQLEVPVETVRAAVASWAERFVRPHLVPRQRRRLAPRDGRPLKVGFVATFLNSAPYWPALLPVFRAFDPQRIQATAYSYGNGEAAVSVRSSVSCWRDFEVMDDGARSLIRADRNDILVDLDGILGHGIELFASRPAPITASWYNVLTSIPVPVFDYVIVDRVVVPEAEQSGWSESIVTMPGTYFSMSPMTARPEPVAAPVGRSGYPTLGSFNRPSKLGAATLDSWGRIMAAMPTAKLALANFGFDAPGAKERVIAALAERGIATERVRIQGGLPGDLFFQAYADIDLALDPFPFNGGTTTFDALWQGVPVVGFPGDRLSARVTASILETAGLSELVAPTLEASERLIADLLSNHAKLIELRSVVASRIRSCPFCDPAAFAGALMDAFDRMFAESWARQSAG